MADLQADIEEQGLVTGAQTTFVAPSVFLGELSNVNHKCIVLWEVDELGSACILIGDEAVRRDEGCAEAAGSFPAPVLAGVSVDRGVWVVASDGHRVPYHTTHILGTKYGAFCDDRCGNRRQEF